MSPKRSDTVLTAEELETQLEKKADEVDSEIGTPEHMAEVREVVDDIMAMLTVPDDHPIIHRQLRTLVRAIIRTRNGGAPDEWTEHAHKAVQDDSYLAEVFSELFDPPE